MKRTYLVVFSRLFYCHFASSLDPKRVIAFWFSSPKREWRLDTRFWTDRRSKRKKVLKGCYATRPSSSAKSKYMWNPALEPPREYGHLIFTATIFWSEQKISLSFSHLKNPLNTTTLLIQSDFCSLQNRSNVSRILGEPRRKPGEQRARVARKKHYPSQ